jgi:hypothetical protein
MAIAMVSPVEASPNGQHLERERQAAELTSAHAARQVTEQCFPRAGRPRSEPPMPEAGTVL